MRFHVSPLEHNDFIYHEIPDGLQTWVSRCHDELCLSTYAVAEDMFVVLGMIMEMTVAISALQLL